MSSHEERAIRAALKVIIVGVFPVNVFVVRRVIGVQEIPQTVVGFVVPMREYVLASCGTHNSVSCAWALCDDFEASLRGLILI